MLALLVSLALAQDVYVDDRLDDHDTLEPATLVVLLDSAAHYGEARTLTLDAVGETAPGYSFLISKRALLPGPPSGDEEVAWGEVTLDGADSVRVRFTTDSEDDLVLRVTPLDADGYTVDDGTSFLIPVRGGKARNNKSKLRKLANAL